MTTTHYHWMFGTEYPCDLPETYEAHYGPSELRKSALDLCNVCDGPIETPNPGGYCNEHLAEVSE